jgi:hypothetical protein
MQLERELTKVVHTLTQRTALLEENWRAATIADRFLATQRLLQAHRLRKEHTRALEDLNLTVQRLWTDLRRHRKYARDAHDELRIFSVEEELKRAEHSRDCFMDAEGLVEELFCVAETFLVSRLDPGEETFRDLCHRRNALEQRIAATRPARAPTPAQARDAFTTQSMTVVYSLTGEQPARSGLHSAIA